MTGFIVRIERDGRVQHLDVTALTDTELVTFVASMCEPADVCSVLHSRDEGWRWVRGLAAWIRDHAQEEKS